MVVAMFPQLEQEEPAHRTGVLPYQHIKQLVAEGHVTAEAPFDKDQIQPASLDLRLGAVAYQVRASFLPGESSRVLTQVKHLTVQELDLTSPCLLQRGAVYIIPLEEEVSLPAGMSARANPKSTIGRLDVFVRLITDYTGEFESVLDGYRGKLYVEVAPRSFNVVVHQGSRLNQLRFIRGHRNAPPSSDRSLNALQETEPLVFLPDGTPGQAQISQGLWLTVDLQGGDTDPVVGYKAARHAPAIDLDRVGYYDPAEFWEPVLRPGRRQVILDPGEFYILGSKEKIRVPPTFAAEMVSYDPSIGEFRIHYAGFFDPGFGYGENDIQGTRAVLEVRSHEVPFVIRDGQRAGRLLYLRLLEPAEQVYGPAIGSSYQEQGLRLSKQFRAWT